MKYLWIIIIVVFGVGVFYFSNQEDNVEVGDTDYSPQEEVNGVSDTVIAAKEQEVYGPYSIKDGKVFFKGELVEEADSESFEVWTIIGFDKETQTANRNFVKVKEGEDDELFYYYATDKNYLFLDSEYVADSDPSSLVKVSHPLDGSYFYVPIFLTDKNNVYYGGCSKFRKLDNIDVNTFEIYGKSDVYFKDKNSVYAVRVGKGFYCEIIELEDADSASFGYFDEKGEIMKDANNIYISGLKVDDADSSSFKSLNDYYFSDNLHYYYKLGNVIVKFRELIEGELKPLEGRFAIDDKNVFYEGVLINTNSDKFVAIDGFVGHDDNLIYFIDPSGYDYFTCIVTRPYESTVRKISEGIYSNENGDLYYYSKPKVDGRYVDSPEGTEQIYKEFQCSAG